MTTEAVSAIVNCLDACLASHAAVLDALRLAKCEPECILAACEWEAEELREAMAAIDGLLFGHVATRTVH